MECSENAVGVWPWKDVSRAVAHVLRIVAAKFRCLGSGRCSGWVEVCFLDFLLYTSVHWSVLWPNVKQWIAWRELGSQWWGPFWGYFDQNRHGNRFWLPWRKATSSPLRRCLQTSHLGRKFRESPAYWKRLPDARKRCTIYRKTNFFFQAGRKSEESSVRKQNSWVGVSGGEGGGATSLKRVFAGWGVYASWVCQLTIVLCLLNWTKFLPCTSHQQEHGRSHQLHVKQHLDQPDVQTES